MYPLLVVLKIFSHVEEKNATNLLRRLGAMCDADHGDNGIRCCVSLSGLFSCLACMSPLLAHSLAYLASLWALIGMLGPSGLIAYAQACLNSDLKSFSVHWRADVLGA